MSPEECLCRRSNLFATLTTPAAGNSASTNYPIPSKAGIYSEKVGQCSSHLEFSPAISRLIQIVVFRGGPEKYEAWLEYKGVFEKSV